MKKKKPFLSVVLPCYNEEVILNINLLEMKNEQFKTNIMCGSCITKVTPVLNEHFGEGKPDC